MNDSDPLLTNSLNNQLSNYHGKSLNITNFNSSILYSNQYNRVSQIHSHCLQSNPNESINTNIRSPRNVCSHKGKCTRYMLGWFDRTSQRRHLNIGNIGDYCSFGIADSMKLESSNRVHGRKVKSRLWKPTVVTNLEFNKSAKDDKKLA